MGLTVGSLFSGVGLLDFGLEQAGLETVWQVEYDDWCREVALPQNFPNTEKFKDVKEVGKHNLKSVDIICGGFPCQDISVANIKGQGLEGERSGLWSEYFRIICELRPKYALIENVPNLLNRGLDRVLSDLASVGYDAEWQNLRASTFGLPTRRKRLFIIAYPRSIRTEKIQVFSAPVPQGNQSRWADSIQLCFETVGYKTISIPERLRMDSGVSFELSEIERVVKGYGNSVAPPVRKWLGEQIIRFDSELNG